MRLLKIVAGMAGLLMAGLLAAQPAAPPPQNVLPPQATRMPPPPPALEAENTWNLDLSTGGRVSIQLRPDLAPNHVERIKVLTRRGFYNGLTFHRVIEGFMAQGGDPTGTGTGESDLPDLATEINGLPHVRGAVAMARAQDFNSANSQFYIMLAPRLVLDRNYTVLGRVVAGIQFVDAIERGEPPINPTRIVRASIGSDNVPPMTADELRAAAAQMAAAAGVRPAGQGASGRLGPAVPPPPAIRMPDPPQPQRRPRRPQQ
jgi:peptidylprolyl isomerase